MQRDQAYILDIREASRLAMQYVSGKTYEDFLSDIQCQDAVIRRIALIGEAARRVSEETRREHPKLPWREMVSMRNLVIHEYDEIDLAVVWDTVNKSLRELMTLLDDVLPADSSSKS
jgi:uncharacterized protein with HEPN domain